MEKLRVGLAHGDVNGIGYELIIKIMAENAITEVCTPILFGSSKIAAFYRKDMSVENFNLTNIQNPQDANPKRCSVVNCIDDEVKVEPGKESKESDEMSMIALREALSAIDANKIDVITVAPQGVGSFITEGVAGCSEFLAKQYDASNVMPILVGNHMKVSFVNLRVPFKNIIGSLSVDKLVSKIQSLNKTLINDFGVDKPRIGVLALNPTSAEYGKMGNEEHDIIIPAIEQCRENGIMALGPYLADSMFSGNGYSGFDVILAMYHDQGMIPFKSIEGYTGSVFMSGLPFVYTTTVNGCGFDIAGKDKADESGFRNAVYLGIDIYNKRQQEAELRSNPLRHYKVGGNRAESDMNVEEIAGLEKDE